MAANYVANRFTNGRPEWGTTSGGHRWLLAGVFLAEGDGDAALELLAPLEEALPGQYEVLAGLGFARFLRGELEQAKGYLEKARRCCTALAESEIRLWWWPRYVRA